MKKLIIIFTAFTFQVSAQQIYVIGTDTIIGITEPQIDKILVTYINLEECNERFDTLSVSYDAAMQAINLCEQEVVLLRETVETVKVVASGYRAEKETFEKQLKKEVRKKKFAGGMLYAVTGVAVVATVLLLIK